MTIYHKYRRLYPRIYNRDYVVLKGLRSVLIKVVKKYFPKSEQERRLIDYGCGDIPYKPLFEKAISEYIACDIDGNQLADCHIGHDGSVPLEDAIFDIVLSIQVLEHVQDINAYLDESYRLLKKGGKLLLSTHGFWTYHPHPHDLRRWTLEGLTFEIKRHGFEIMDTYGILGMLAFSSQLRVNFFEEQLLSKGILARILLASISLMYQLLMILQDKITPKNSFKKNFAVYFVVAQKN